MRSDNGSKKGKLSKLTQLENEVAKLSEQLRADKQTISLLKQSLTERDLKIHELESKLNYAQQSLLKKTVFTIHQCRDQIKSGIDEKVINPAFVQIQQQIEVVKGIISEAKDLISKKKMLIHENIDATANRVHQCPDQAIRYFESWIVEPARLLVNGTAGSLGSNIRNSRDMVEQKIIYPGKLRYDKVIAFIETLPTQSQVIFQMWLADPVIHKIEALPVAGKALRAHIDELLKGSLRRLKSGVEQGLANTAEAIKKSPFWDGKRNIEVTQ